MSFPLRELLDLLDLEPLEVNIYRGRNRDIGTGRVFGGQVLSQALVAAHANTDAVMTSEVLRTLERKALVRRLPHPTDARAKRER